MTECTAIPNSDARATGGQTIITEGDYVIHTFMSSGIFQVTDSTLTDVEVLVVGGGGGGGRNSGGGGGGGGVLYSASKAVSSNSVTVTVGDGGTGTYFDSGRNDPIVIGTDGGASVFDDMVANGGKLGTSYLAPPFDWNGGASGSGKSGGVSSVGSGGGGGGAGGAGGAPPDGSQGGDGGPGIESTISGASSYYGGGGGGGAGGAPGSAGLGGGAQGSTTVSMLSGTSNTGG